MNHDRLDHINTVSAATEPHDENHAIEHRYSSVIVNADDWGRDVLTTGPAFDCFHRGAVSSVSAMVFMEDSRRAADVARQHGIDTGLHLNLTTCFSARECPLRLREEQRNLAHFLRSNRLARVMYHPGLASSFEYVVRSQFDEFERLYGGQPGRVDGHHHMHLCGNVLHQRLLPEGIIVRRNFSFCQGEKSLINRLYRRWQDRALARRYPMTDFFFALRPMEPRRLARILTRALRSDVEIATHPVNDEEYRFLAHGKLTESTAGITTARGYTLHHAVPVIGQAAPAKQAGAR